MHQVTPPKKSLDVVGVVESLRDMLASGQIDDMFSLIERLLGQMKAHNADLELRLMKLLREKFGRASEKIEPAQLSLFLSVLASSSQDGAVPEETPAIPASPAKEKPATRGHGRNSLPAHLPRRPLVIPLAVEDCACETCGKARRVFDYDCSELLDYEPGGFFVVEILREKGVDDCTCAPKPLFATAPAADMVIPSGIPGPGLLAKIVTAKYADHLPLERQSGMYAREGVKIAPSTLCDWIAAAAVLLLRIAARIEALALLSYVLWTDDTGLTVLDEKRAKGTKRGHVWVYVGDARWAAFKYTPDWKPDGPLAFLATRIGYLVADGYAGYRSLYQGPLPAKVVEVACWMHCRRYFKQALDAKDLRAAVAVEYIRRLYEVERLADERKVDADERLRLRQEFSRPVYEKLGAWVRDLHGREPPKGKLGRALTYAVNPPVSG